MNFFIIPYLFAVDVMVPPTLFWWSEPFFRFNVTVDSTTDLADYSENVSNFKLTTAMICRSDSMGLACELQDTKVFHRQNSTDRLLSDTEMPNGSMTAGISSITNETFNLEFEPDGVKISSCSETSERSLRMLQKIVDLLHTKVDFDDPRSRGSRIETHTIVHDCPVTTKATFEETGKTSKKPGQIFFKIAPHLDQFDESKTWILEINKTKDVERCKNNQDYFFGSESENYMTQGSRITSDITSSYNNIEITNEKFVSIGYTEGTVTDGIDKFATNNKITVSLALYWDVFIPIDWARFGKKVTNQFM